MASTWWTAAGYSLECIFSAPPPVSCRFYGPPRARTQAPALFRASQTQVRGVNEEPLAVADIIERVRARNEIPPRILVVNTTTDYMSLRASLARTGANRVEDLPIPANVRVYDIAGASHALVRLGDCKLPVAVLDWHPILRATLLVLDHW